jgi:hypothetical protein
MNNSKHEEIQKGVLVKKDVMPEWAWKENKTNDANPELSS